jgi:hypothetical protein
MNELEMLRKIRNELRSINIALWMLIGAIIGGAITIAIN